MRNCDEPPGSDRPLGTGRKGPANPLTVKFEFVVVEGEEAKLFAARQSAAILAVLRWIAEHNGDAERDGNP